MMWKLRKKIDLLKIIKQSVKKETYQYFSTNHNKYQIKYSYFPYINLFTNRLKYKPLSSKFLKVSNDAAQGLNNIVYLKDLFVLIIEKTFFTASSKFL